jgi:cytochrome o ubiquinol oxidase subunit IV
MQNTNAAEKSTVRLYLTGFTLAILLTAIPFGVVASRALPVAATFGVILVAAIVQILVHLRYFLHLSFSRGNEWFLLSLVFTFVIIALMVGGTIWIMWDLNAEMTMR